MKGASQIAVCQYNFSDFKKFNFSAETLHINFEEPYEIPKFVQSRGRDNKFSQL